MAKTLKMQALQEKTLKKETKLQSNVSELKELLGKAIEFSNQEADFMQMILTAAENRFKPGAQQPQASATTGASAKARGGHQQ